MKEQLISVLEQIYQLNTQKSYPVFQQGDLNPLDAYPPAFFTYWNTETDDESFYNDLNHRCVWMFTVYFYSYDKELVNTVLLEARKKLRENGWIVDGKGYDVPSDEKDYTGRAIDVLFIEREDQKNVQS